MDILDEITAHKRLEVAARKREVPLSALQARVEPLLTGPKPVSMASALLASPSGIIAEFKRKSPSKGWIKEEGDAAVIPLGYQRNGAAALFSASILAAKNPKPPPLRHSSRHRLPSEPKAAAPKPQAATACPLPPSRKSAATSRHRLPPAAEPPPHGLSNGNGLRMRATATAYG